MSSLRTERYTLGFDDYYAVILLLGCMRRVLYYKVDCRLTFTSDFSDKVIYHFYIDKEIDP